MIMILIK